MHEPRRRSHRHTNDWAFLVHRISGLLLAGFLPVHFVALSLAIRGEASLDHFIRWTQHPMVKLSETILVLALAAHLTGGIRLLATGVLTNLRRMQKRGNSRGYESLEEASERGTGDTKEGYH